MNKVNILVVDDRPEGILAVQAVLSSPSYNIVTASSGNEALKHLLTLDFAVILMDVQMPIMNGFETASVIKTREKSKDIPIIFMSAINQDEQYVYQGYGVGAIDYLLKPFDPYILRSKVAIFVDIYRKNLLIKDQANKLRENEARVYAQKMDQLELENLRRYQYLADSIPQIVFRLTTEGHYKYFNKVWYEYTGLDLNYSSEDSWKNVIHPHDLGSLNKLLEASENMHGLECECRILNKHGQFRWHLIRIQPEDDSWLGTATDIEDRKKAEEMQSFLSTAGELLVETLDYRQLLQSVAKFAVPYLGDWVAFEVVDNNDQLETIVLHHRDQKKHESTEKIYNEKFRQENSSNSVFQVFKTSRKLVLNENQIENSGALILPLGINGRIVGTMTLVTQGEKYDQNLIEVSEELSRRVTYALENARLYKLSQEAIEVRNDFLSIASHELNTPITSLKLQLQMVKKSLSYKEGEFPRERFTKGVEASCKQVDRLINLIQILLDVTRIQSGKFTFSFESFNVQDVVNEVLERHKEILENSECQIDIQNELKLEVKWDKTRVEQVLTNLLTNAIKYAPGKIELKVFEKDNMVAIEVQDHGKGIPESKLKTIFDRFERATSNESVSGLGLGLFIVKQIADGHHGRVDVRSEKDKGTNFTILLPKDATTLPDKTELGKESHVH